MIKKYYSRVKHLYYSYFIFFLKYFSLKKLVNLLKNSCEFFTKRVYLKSVPPIVHIDVCNSCILHCPLCATGKNDKSQTKAIIRFEDFKPIFDKIKDYTFFVWLYNWGEPFLCSDIFKIINYCHENNVGVKIDSNLNYYNDDILRNIVKSKIDYISLSIDGFSQENYQFYRKGGSLQKVLEGMVKLIEYKKKAGSKYPILIWQFLVNNKNKDEVERAESWAKENKIDIFEARSLSLFTDVDSKFQEKEYKKFLSDTSVPKEVAMSKNSQMHCRYLWDSFAVNPDKSFCPCPVIYKDKDCFGFFKKNDARDIKEIVNLEIFIESRKLFKINNYKPKVYTPCLRCNWYTKL